jgi:hypothetical protein
MQYLVYCHFHEHKGCVIHLQDLNLIALCTFAFLFVLFQLCLLPKSLAKGTPKNLIPPSRQMSSLKK